MEVQDLQLALPQSDIMHVLVLILVAIMVINILQSVGVTVNGGARPPADFIFLN